MVSKTRSQTSKVNVGQEVHEWASSGEGEEIMLMLSEKTLFFTKEGASDVFTQAEIATLTWDGVHALAFAWLAHTKKHKTKQEALVVAFNYFAQKMHDLLMTIPLERRNAAADFIEADGFWQIVQGGDMD
jgi:hypothetical protein